MAADDVKIVLTADDKASAKVKGLGTTLKGLGSGVSSVIGTLGKFAGVIGTVGAALTSGAIAKAVGTFSEVGDAVEKMSRRTGLAAETVSVLRFAADQTGTSIETMETGLRAMSRSLSDAQAGSKVAKDQFKALGVDLKALTDLSTEQKFFELGKSIAAIEDPIKKMDAAMSLFGKSGAELIPFFDEAGAGFDEFKKKATELGVVFDEAAAKKAAELNDRIGELKASFAGITNVIASAFVPVVLDLMKKMEPLIKQLGEFLAQNIPIWIAVAQEWWGRMAVFIGETRDVLSSLLQQGQRFIQWLIDTGALTVIWDNLRTSAMNVWVVFQQNLLPALKRLWEAAQPLMPFFTEFVKVLGVMLLGALLGVLKTLELVLIASTQLATFMADFMTKSVEVATKVWDGFVGVLGKVIDAFRSVWEWAQKAASVVGGAVGRVGSAVGIQPRAAGGPVIGGNPYLVGERGPELFVPSTSGRILPNGSGGAVINMTFQSPMFLDRDAADKFAAEVMDRLKLGLKL